MSPTQPPILTRPSFVAPLLLLALLAIPMCAPAQTPGVFREFFKNQSTNDNSYPATAAFTNQVASTPSTLPDFEAPQNAGDGYGQRLRAFVIAPMTGDYRFWVSSDEWSDLFLSSDETAGNRVRIANVSGATGYHEWNREQNQKSVPIALQAGRRYYIEAIHKEGGGPDHLEVRWQIPDGSVEEPIPGKVGSTLRLIPYKTNAITAPVLLYPLTNVTVVERRSVTLVAMANNQSPVTYQWQQAGADLAGATGSSLTISSADLTRDNGQRFSCRLSNSVLTTNTVEITLTVLADTTAPTLTRVAYLDSTHLQVVFSEPISADSGALISNYTLSSGASVTAVSQADAQTVTLTTSALTYGSPYILTVNGVGDAMVPPNVILPNSNASFLALEFTSSDVGKVNVPGTAKPVTGGFDLSVSGKDILGTSDQFQYNWQIRTGNFDVQVRVASITASDAWAKAGLMARSSLATNAAFAMTLTTPGVEGAFFISRSAAGVLTVPVGNFPPNYPDTWIRLQRVDNLFTGFASRDGQHWMKLGSSAVGVPSTVYLGMALAARSTNTVASAQFREFSDVTSVASSETLSQVEPAGPSSRNTPLAITEIMYQPIPPRPDFTNSLQYVELFNSNPYFEDVSGYHFEGDIQFTLPAGTILQGGQYLVVAGDPDSIRRAYGISNLFGPFTGSLKRSGVVRLEDKINAVMLEIPYSNQPPWPVAADGTGHSLVLARPSRGEGYPDAWEISDRKGGSPGRLDPVGREPLRGVVINEFLANSTGTTLDYVELYNHNSQSVDVSGAWLSDSPTTNKFRIPNGTVIPAGGFLSYDETQLHFSLSAQGETLFLVNSNRNRVLDAVRFGDQRPDVSLGRYPDGGREWYPMKQTSPGVPNVGILIDDIVINELMYKPLSGDDNDGFVELFNQGNNPVEIGGWKFVSGISFKFPPLTVIPPKGYVVVARNKVSLLSRYPGVLTEQNTYGDYSGKPTRDGNRVALAMPVPHVSLDTNGVAVTNIIYPVIEEVTFGLGGRWGEWADGNGSSLELRDPRANHRLAYNWGDSDDTKKASWTVIEATGLVDNGTPFDGVVNRLEVTMLNSGECLLDDVEVFSGTSAANKVGNSGFESGLAPWVAQGDHVQSTLESGEGYKSGKSLHIRATARGDTGANRIRVALATPVVSGQSCTLRAKVRWLRGWPELVIRLKGNGFELPGVMQLPTNLGTPGAANSQATANTPPAISEVRHTPVLPSANEDVVITARAQDPDGLKSLTLFYRLDPATNYASLAMTDDGKGRDEVAGDGLFSAVIPGRSLGTLVAFYVEGVDQAIVPATSRLPEDAPVRECLVRFGEVTPASGFASYHFWMTAKNVKAWTGRPSLSNERTEGTFVYGNFRTVYNMGGKYAGSPYHQGFESPVTAGCHYSLEFPLDDTLLGTENFNKIHAPGNGPFDDDTGQREQTAYWVMRQMDLPYNYRRFVAFYFNGNRKQQGTSVFMEDTQTPGSDVVRQRFPNDSNGNLYKIQPWFEFDDVSVVGGGGAGFNNVSWCTLLNFYTGPNGDVKKLARYRYNWLTRAANGTANDYTNVWDLTDAANTPSRGDYVANMKHLAEMEEWLRIFAVQHSVGNWDSFGNRNAQNMYGYKPTQGKWTLMSWDFNIVLGNSGSDGPAGDDLFQYNTADAAMLRIYQTPEFRRMYLRAFKDIVDGPMSGPAVASLVDAKYAEMTAGGLSVGSPTSIKTWITQRRAFLASEVKKYGTNFNVFGTASYTTNSDLALLTGSAPLEVKKIIVNGIEYPLSWVNPNNKITDPSYVTTWRILVPLVPGNNTLVVEAVDRLGVLISGMSKTLTLTRTTPEEDPRGVIVINEINYSPSMPNASFIELYNTSTTQSFDLSGWRLDGVGYLFPVGSVLSRGQYLVLARDRVGVWRAFGTDVAVFGQYNGGLSDAGEVLSLVKPGLTPAQDVVVDRVRYEPGLPWPESANGFGSSLQVVDASKENSRVSNWASAADQGWVKATITATNKSPRLLVYLTSVGDAFIDDVSLTGPDGKELVVNGGFESSLTGTWRVGTNLVNSTLTSAVAHSGNSSLHLVSTAPFPLNGGTNQALWQDVAPFSTNQYTLSFWYLSTTNAYALVARTLSSSPFLLSRQLAPIYATPGEANNVIGALPEYDDLWLNEVLPYNVTGLQDNQGDRDPWVEVYNAGNHPVSLAGYFLTDDYSQLERWAFPSTAVLQPGQFMVVWADGEPEASTATVQHANFSLALTNGSIALVRSIAAGPQIVDYLNYSRLAPDQSYGSYPDGQPFFRQRFSRLTPGAANDGTPPTVLINEWMAANGSTLADPADGKYHDWFELYNPADTAADLSGFFLTDTLNNLNQFAIPTGTTLPSGAYLLVWADKLSSFHSPESADLHAGFNLSKKGGTIALIAPSGTPIDVVTYASQTNDISQGRFPDGGGDLVFMTTPTPRSANSFGSGVNTPPKLAPIANRAVDENTRLTFTATATDKETPAAGLVFSLDPGAPAGATLLPDGRFRWRPTEDQGSKVFTVTVRVTDTGKIPLSDTATFTVTVNEVNSPPVFDPRSHYGKVGQLLTFATAIDTDIPTQQLAFSLGLGAPAGLSIHAVTGVVTWTPTADQAGVHPVTVTATDNGVPPLTSAYTYSVEVVGSGESLLVGDIAIVAGKVVVRCLATVGKSYQLQSSQSLSTLTWLPLGAAVKATSPVVAFNDTVVLGESRYYRILELP